MSSYQQLRTIQAGLVGQIEVLIKSVKSRETLAEREKTKLYDMIENLRTQGREAHELLQDMPEAQNRSYFRDRYYEYMTRLFIEAEQIIVAKPVPRMSDQAYYITDIGFVIGLKCL